MFRKNIFFVQQNILKKCYKKIKLSKNIFKKKISFKKYSQKKNKIKKKYLFCSVKYILKIFFSYSKLCIHKYIYAVIKI